jgi:uncharacterized protein (DUF1919 family)
VNQPHYTTESEVTKALADGTFHLHHDNCMKAYEEARNWQKHLKALAAQNFFFRRKARAVNGTARNFVFQFTTYKR